MKKIITGIISLLIVLLSALSIIFYEKDSNTDYDKLRVAEVTHSAFYAPWYIAIENGYFEEENIDIELILASGADKVSAAVLSGDVDIGFCGPESTIYIYNGGEDDYLVTFAGLTKRDGQFIVSRSKSTAFSINDLSNKEVLAGRYGGMPAINFKNALDKNEVLDVDINYSIEFANLTSAFISGNGDYVNLFEPNATMLEKQGFGYIVGNVGSLSGEVPYTAFNTKLSFWNNNQDLLSRFNKALNKGLAFVNNNESEIIADNIIKQFPDISRNDLIKIIDNYKKADTWLNNTVISETLFKNLETMMIDNDLINEYVDFKDLVKQFND